MGTTMEMQGHLASSVVGISAVRGDGNAAFSRGLRIRVVTPFGVTSATLADRISSGVMIDVPRRMVVFASVRAVPVFSANHRERGMWGIMGIPIVRISPVATMAGVTISVSDRTVG